MTELRLFDAPGAEVAQIETDGTTFKPFVDAIRRMVTEARLEVTTDGLSVTAVDPAIVCSVQASLDAEAFETYEVEQEQTLGVDFDELKSLIRRARKSSDDTLELRLNEREATAVVSRGYNDHDVVSQGTMQLIDPDAVREPAEIPELDRDVSVTVDYAPLTDALSHAVSGPADICELSVKGVNQHTDALYARSNGDTRDESVAVDGIESEASATVLYSQDHVSKILGGITDVSPNDVTLTFDDETPITVTADNTEAGLSAEYFLAPRIES